MGVYFNQYFDLLLEKKSVKDEIGTASSKLATMYSHLLKYIYNPTKQSGSWIDTIMRDCNEVNKVLERTNVRNGVFANLDKVYKDALSEFYSDNPNVNRKIVPKTIPDELQIDLILNIQYLYGLFVKYVYHEDAKNRLRSLGLL